MQVARVRLGELLVEAQVITRTQLDEILELQKRDSRRLGTLLVEAGLVTETQVTQILSQQLSVPWVSLYHIDFSRQLLNLVPHETAEKFCLVPIFVRRVRGFGETLYVAMDDPSDEAAQREVAQYSGLAVRAMIAPPTDIRSAIRVYYAAGTDTSSLSEAVAELEGELAGRLTPVMTEPDLAAIRGRSSSARESTPPVSLSAPPVSLSAPPVSLSAPPSARNSDEPPDSSPQIEAREVSMPAPKLGRKRKMVTLTLLDGTQVNLPARRPREPSNPAPKDATELTARDMVAALRAVAHGADASEILGENDRWEPMLAALLSLLLKKHLIADWEFVDEFRKV
jgi:type IV pilus assembly protein PilB